MQSRAAARREEIRNKRHAARYRHAMRIVTGCARCSLPRPVLRERAGERVLPPRLGGLRRGTLTPTLSRNTGRGRLAIALLAVSLGCTSHAPKPGGAPPHAFTEQ